MVCSKYKQILPFSVSTAQFPILGSSCLSQELSKYLYSEIFQTQLMGTEIKGDFNKDTLENVIYGVLLFRTEYFSP